MSSATLDRITSEAMGSHLQLNDTFGALLVSGIVSALLYGLVCAQTWEFVQQRHATRLPLKMIVLGLFALNGFDLALSAHSLYFYLVTNFTSLFVLAVPVWSLMLHIATTSVSNFFVRSLFALSVWQMSSRNYFISLGLIGLSALDLVTGILVTSKIFHAKAFTALDSVTVDLRLHFASGIVADVCLAGVFCAYLWKSRGALHRNESQLRVGAVYGLGAGWLAVADAIAVLASYNREPRNFVFISLYMLLSKLYLSAYLCSANTLPLLLHTRTVRQGTDPSPSSSPESYPSALPVQRHHRETLGFRPGHPRADSDASVIPLDSKTDSTEATPLSTWGPDTPTVPYAQEGARSGRSRRR